ncbi:MAG: hypothetical protein QXU18_09765 [Thermoplasmatales archaeon]
MPYPYVPLVSRKDLDPVVVVCPSHDTNEEENGVSFLKNHYLWMSVKIADSMVNKIKYFALYVGEPTSQVKYFAEVSRIVDRSDKEFMKIHGFDEPRPEDRGKKAIELKNYTLVELSDPIRSVPGRGVRGIIYSRLSDFIRAETIQDLTNAETTEDLEP